MTQATKTRLEEELSALREKLADAGQRIGEAGEGGAWHENSAFELAHADHHQLAHQILRITEVLKSPKIIQPNPRTDHIDIGHEVHLQLDDEREAYTILGPHDSDPSRGRISFNAPLGKALLGRQPGETIICPGDPPRRAMITNFGPGKF